MNHVGKEVLRRVLSGAAGPGERDHVSNHVFSCTMCRSVAREVVAGLRREGVRPAGPLRLLSQIFTIEQETALEATLAEAEWAAMRGLSLQARKERIRELSICRSLSFANLLVRELRACTGYETAEHLAVLATLSINGMDPHHYSEALKLDLNAGAWIELANSRRRAAEWARAKAALHKAEDLLRKGPASPRLEARLLSISGLTLADQGLIKEAVDTLERCRGLYQDLEDWSSVGRTLIQAANVLAEPDPKRGLALLESAIPLLSPEDSGLAILARLLRVDCLIWLNELPKAASLFHECLNRPEVGRTRVRRDFIGARLLHSLGYRKEAERLFGEVISSDLQLALWKDALLDLLYVFGVHVREGDLAKAAAVCERALGEPVLAEFSHEQLRAVWRLLLEAVRRNAIAIGVLAELRLYLAVHWRHPAAELPSISTSADAPTTGLDALGKGPSPRVLP
ncbi:MAG: hypothetical protein ABIS20_03320 [Thermoanaerobaculia bacterium]